uniref:(California timema) hypothetical protein n=1 Tax=Timema californicum TaxID=61474 RepID=A0A7R9JI49_TIMCA|nr:unnamed protein product [Timema californicum]
MAGGQNTWREFLTLPNILKEFNPDLIGYSLGDSLSHQKGSQFNVADGGAMSRDMPFQAKLLVRRMKRDKRVDIKNHWKVVTIHIGSNDFCLDMCYQDEDQVPENHRNDLQRSLDYLQDNLPRTLVNLVTTTRESAGGHHPEPIPSPRKVSCFPLPYVEGVPGTSASLPHQL